jgi:hypothetical protein
MPSDSQASASRGRLISFENAQSPNRNLVDLQLTNTRPSDGESIDRDGADREGAKRSRPNSKREHIRYSRELGSG